MVHSEVREAAHVRNVVGAIEGRAAPPDARALIIESWKRCAAQFRLDPSVRAQTRILTRRELGEFRDPMTPLIRIARPILEDLYRLLEPAGYCILFTDLNGVAIDYLTPACLDDEHRSAGLILGSVWSEAAEGTNGVGTCIVSGRPLTVHRTDHFRSKNAGLSCTCAPVIDPEGRLAAVLDVSTASPERAGSTRYVEHLVEGTSRRLANAWFRERHRDRWVLRLFPDAESLDPAREGLVAMDADGTVAAVSDAARRLLAAASDAGGEDAVPNEGLSRRLAAFLRASGEPRLLSGARPLYLIPVAPAKRPGRHGPAEAPPGAAPAAAPPRTFAAPAGEIAGQPAAATADPRLAEAARIARLALAGGVPLLVTGESGSGKSTFVRDLHAAASLPPRQGRRRPDAHDRHADGGGRDGGRPLVELDLAGRDTATVERLVAAALGEAGLVVLDEVGELSADARHALLRVLKRCEAEPGGRPALIATSRLPPEALRTALRPDLYFRLAGAVVALPPLRRRTDRAALVAAMLAEVAAGLGRAAPALSPVAAEALADADWPGNLRELASVLRLTLIAAGEAAVLEAGDVRFAALPEDDGTPERWPMQEAAASGRSVAATADRGGLDDGTARGWAGPATGGHGGGPIVDQAVEDLERLLAANRWCVSKVARLLAVDRSTIHRRMNRFGLVPPQRRD